MARASTEPWTRTLGALPGGEGRVEFRVWAREARAVGVRLPGGLQDLRQQGGGVWAAEVEAAPGDDYVFVLDGEEGWPDPASREQPEGVKGPSRVFDTRAFRWTDEAWQGVALEDLVVYELHVGTFTDAGTFDAAIPHLAPLRELGVTAIEVMPVATFPGERGWGYDGLYTGAPHPGYGGPQGFQRLVDAAHGAGLAVILDVVYNHVGPGSEALAAFGPYFTDRYETFWGQAINYDGPGSEGVREWAIQNALLWVDDYHVDGLRLDATHAIFDEGPHHVLAELAERVRAANTRALVISEMEIGDDRPTREWGHDARWADELHHHVHVLLTGEREGYYERYGNLTRLAELYREEEPQRLVVCAQNHDQVGNRATGDRLPPDALRVAAACVLFHPGTPLLFMGEEYAEPNPFQFFSDHIDPSIADATRAGRKQEFERFEGFKGEVPDPQDPATFDRSKLSRAEDADHRALYEELLRLRRELPRETHAHADEDARTLTLRRGDTTLVADFANRTVELRR